MPITFPPISEQMLDLFRRLDSLRDLAQEGDEEIKRRSIEEGQALGDYELAASVAFLAASGSVKERECVAKRDTIALYRKLQDCIALRRSAVAAAKTYHHDFEALTAAFHLANREMKLATAA